MAQELTSKATRNLLGSSVGQDAYKKIVQGWTKTKLKRVLSSPTPNSELRRARNNIIYAELLRRRK